MSNETYTEAQQDRKLAQARALLAKAESTSFPAEAEALTARANELIVQYGLDASKAYVSDRDSDELIVVDMTIDGAYALRQMALVANVATPLRVSAVRVGPTMIKLLGFRSDVERVQLLATSLLLQVSNAMAHTPVPRYENGRTFRTNFYNAFIVRVKERLEEAEAVAQRDERQESGSDSTALVLVDRNAQVKNFVKSQIGRTTKSSSRSRYSSAGSDAGRRAGDRADIGQRRMGGTRRAIDA